MDAHARNYVHESYLQNEEYADTRKGPWTEEEDAILSDYVNTHGEGRWNAAARCAGLKRTGKSCRLRWLNYLRPDVRRGNITLQEQLLILELHSRWGNRWSKIAQHLPGRTDNEIKNYWRTRVQKQAKQLKCDVNSKQFRDAMRYIWMPRLMERIQASSSSSSSSSSPGSCTGQPTTNIINYNNDHIHATTAAAAANDQTEWRVDPNIIPEISGTSSDSLDPVSDVTEYQNQSSTNDQHYYNKEDYGSNSWAGELEIESNGSLMIDDGETLENIWNEENIWFLQQQLM